MTTLTDIPLLLTGQSIQPDNEIQLLSRLSEQASRVGIGFDRTVIVNLFVALKSKPLAILAGPIKSGKIALVRGLAQSLVEQGTLRVQMLTGHPWWAEGSDGIAEHTRLHTRFSTEKILSIIEEAGQPDNTHQVFIACLTHISPAELLSFYTDVAFQLRHGQIMKLGDTHFSEPIPFPPNLRIIGTMDTPAFDWWDNNLLLSTIVIQIPQAGVLPDLKVDKHGFQLNEYEFLQSCIYSRNAAYRKVFPVLKRQRQPLYPLLQVEAILKRYIPSLELVLDEVIIYLANSWSKSGNGLFHPLADRNLTIALDLAFAQILLPRAVDAIRNLEILRNRLINILSGQFWHSAAFVTTLASQG